VQRISIAWYVEGDGYDMNIYFYDGRFRPCDYYQVLELVSESYIHGHEFVR